jgi:hypothetical protein
MLVNVEHDPRKPPVGRIIDARVVDLADGETGVEALMEIFEPTDELDFKPEGRELAGLAAAPDRVVIAYDKSFEDPESQAILAAIGRALGTEPERQLKKAVDPITVLTIAAGFTVAQLAGGFLKAIGQDGWAVVKSRLREIVANRRRKSGRDWILLADLFLTGDAGQRLNVQILITNPVEDDVEGLYEQAVRLVDRDLARYLAESDVLARVVLEYAKGEVRRLFGVRRDGVPVRWQP